MKNKEFYKLLNKNKCKSNSGFTLTELLVAVIMSTFVIGALGFGLMQVLRLTQKGNSEIAARNETSRALDFVSDEMRSAQAIEVDMATGAGSNIKAVAPSYDLPTGGTVRLALDIPGVEERVVYSVAPPESTSPFKGPLAIYRWGPNLGANGEYTDPASPGGWSNEALVDGVSDEDQSISCGGANVDYQGFFACVVDDDGDGTSGEPEDSDGQAITAQLYFTGGTKTAGGEESTYSADTKAVARARTAPGNKSEDLNSYTVSYKTLGAVYGCDGAGSTWDMRTDFINNPSDPDNESANNNKKWVHVENRQPQPIKIDTNNPLEISSIPIAKSNCISRGGDKAANGETYTNKDLTKDSSIYEKNASGDYVLQAGKPKLLAEVHRVKHTIDFDNPATYNGYVTDKVKVTNADTNVADGTVVFLRNGSIIPNNDGYDPDNNASNNATSTGDQKSLGDFLAEIVDSNDDPIYVEQVDGQYQIKGLNDSERIVAFEVGQEHTATDQPGFDLQDNIFILSSDVFSEKVPNP